ncbi:MAG: homoserine dehydrogenase [Lachnospiraceae bacterium]|nr:homoserine dehydrogenase [Lachnospiraceae bacterium]
MIHVAVFGYGTVGKGVVEVIDRNNDIVSAASGDKVSVKYILDLLDFPGDPNEAKIVHDVNVIINDPGVSIICETMGGTGAAYKFTKAALEQGKSVCTSNKELVAKHGAELIKLAKANGCAYLFEASVGGGIPVLRTLTTALTAERITQIAGILNGTTNFILTKMEEEGAGFDETLRTAQELGYAEADPTADIEGHDTARKISILADIMSGHFVDSDNVPTVGIKNIDKSDIALASKAGYKIRLLGIADRADDDSVSTAVAPYMLSKSHPLAGVCDVFNAIFVTGNMLGETMYYGKGAGKLATASAVVADLIDAARKGSSTMYPGWDEVPVKARANAYDKHRYLVRCDESNADKAKALFEGAEEIGVCDGKFGLITRPMDSPEMEDKFDGDNGIMENWIEIYE